MDIIETLWMRCGPLIRLALPGDSPVANSMANHTRALDVLKHDDSVAVRVAVEADSGGAAHDLEGYLPA